MKRIITNFLSLGVKKIVLIPSPIIDITIYKFRQDTVVEEFPVA
jgi:hypothetical protein